MVKINSENESKNTESGTRPMILGAFVQCWRVIQKSTTGVLLIKLSAINTINPLDDTDSECIFYTYKDCCYLTELSPNELRRAIDSFIFEPDKNWETYGY